MMLRIQNENALAAGEFAMSADDYHREYGLDHEKMKAANPDAIIIHPLPLKQGRGDHERTGRRREVLALLQTNGTWRRGPHGCLDLLMGSN
jgi:aspartate carbamoyltransferase catalytic subunit